MQMLSARAFNTLLAAGVVLILLGGSAALFGTGWERIERYQSELRERSQRAESWALQRSVFRNPSDAMRAARRARWAELLERVVEVDGQAALIAHVAEKLSGPSLRAVEIERRGAEALAENEEALPASHLDAPEGSESVELVEVPIAVSFRASYADTLALLTRIERREIAARLDSLDLKREYPGVAVRLGLTWYLRKSAGQPG